jgi:TRAP-type uncharacterized transport system substrate-binding protein
MSQRMLAIIALIAFVVLVMGVALTGGKLGLGDTPTRVSFQISTGTTEGVYFPVGQALAGLISHPLGVGRCDTATVCGPAGVVLSTRTSQGAADNLRAVNEGLVDSGFADGDVIAALFPEQAHLVVAAKSNIQSVADLRGKRVFIGQANSGSLARSRAILSAYRVRAREVMSDELPATLLRQGKIDAYFAVAGVPLDSIRALLAERQARLLPIDGEGRDRLIARMPQLFAAVIPAGIYPGIGPVETVGTRAWWFTSDSESDPLIYGLTRALFNPANQAGLAASHPAGRDMNLDSAAENPPAPIHPGAARFYREAGRLN